MKFKVGDKVRVRKDSKVSSAYAGLEGRIVSIHHKNPYPYYVQLNGANKRLFHAHELVKEE